MLDAVAARLPLADPQADVVLTLTCWSCGHEWDAPFDVADRFVILGYADAGLSREYAPDELAAIKDGHQVVSL